MSETEMWALDVLSTAEVVNKFTDTVWVCVDRHAWDEYIKSTGYQDAGKCVFQTQE